MMKTAVQPRAIPKTHTKNPKKAAGGERLD